MKEVKFKTNINCGSCIKSVTPFLNELDDLEEWKVDTMNPDKVLTVEISEDIELEVINAVKTAGFEINKL